MTVQWQHFHTMNIKISEFIIDHINSRYNLNRKSVLSVNIDNIYDELVYKFGEEYAYLTDDICRWDKKMDWVIAKPTDIESVGCCFEMGENTCLIADGLLLALTETRVLQATKNITSILELPTRGKYQRLAVCYTNHPAYLAASKCQIHPWTGQK